MLTSGILSSLHSTNSDLLDLHSTTADDSGVHSTSQDRADSTIDSKPRGSKTCNSLRAATAALAISASNHNRSKAASNQGKFSIWRFQLYTCSSCGCGKGFTTKCAQTYHQKQHSMTDSDQFLCDYKFPQDGKVCDKSFQRKNLLKQHMNGHIG